MSNSYCVKIRKNNVLFAMRKFTCFVAGSDYLFKYLHL